MSKNYEFLIMLNLDYSEENILAILENGERFECIYKDDQGKIVNVNQSMEILWRLYSQQSPPLIRTKFYKTHFYIWFYNESNKICLYISPTHIAWKKRYDLSGWYGINFYRYQKFMLRLIGNNIVTHLQTYEYFNESYESEDKKHDKKIYIKFYIYWAYDIYHHLKVNGSMLRIVWLDSNKHIIDIKKEDNALENIIYNEDTSQCWYGLYKNITLKFSLHQKHVFIIEPIGKSESYNAINQEEIFNIGLRTTIELFKNTPVLRFITFQNDEDIEAINKMDE